MFVCVFPLPLPYQAPLPTALPQAIFCLSEYVLSELLRLAVGGGYAHELLEPAVNRAVLARHIGTDLFACAVVSFLGVSRMASPKVVVVVRTVEEEGDSPDSAYFLFLFLFLFLFFLFS